MDLGLRGRKAIVTGATRGIGRAIAETLAAEGADVAICARNRIEIDETVAALASKGAHAIGAQVDVADGAALETWVAEAGRTLGGIDILVSNPSALAMGNGRSDWQRCIEVDVLGAMHSIEAALPFLERAVATNNDASIVMIASVAATEVDYESAYGAGKAALIHFAKGIARRHAPKRVRANVVSPGTVYFKGGFWNQVEQHMPDRFRSFLERNPMGRMAALQEVANAAVFLASPASSFTTGANLVVDGAITARVNF